MRKVMISIWETNVFSTPATFHMWGHRIIEDSNGIYSYTVGIVELEDGKVMSLIPDEIMFLDKPEGGINWTELRNAFFKECTTETPREESGKKVNIAPHDLFEWFKKEILEYIS